MSKSQVVQAQCPKCKNTLRIPASWIHQAMKCKHCGTVFQAKAPGEKKGNLIGRAFRAATTLHKRKPRKKSKDGISPLAGAPVAMPVAQSVAGAPVAAPVAMAVPAGAAIRANVPVAAPVAMNLVNPPRSARRRSRGSWQKIAFVLLFLGGLGGLGAFVYQANPELFTPEDGSVASASPESGNTATTGSLGSQITGKKTAKSQPNKFVPASKASKSKPNELFLVKPTTKRVVPVYTGKTAPPVKNPTNPSDTSVVYRPSTDTYRPIDNMPSSPSQKPNDIAYKNWPRRMLAVSINNYLYQNPVSYGSEQPFDKAVYSLAGAIKIPNDQVNILSDQARPSIPPTKAIVEDAISRFLAASRPMDHVVLLFAGHGLEIEGNAYLVPLMGEAAEVKSLIPLDWVYARLAACPAQQKLLILDVARYDPKRGEEFGKTEPMGSGFASLLQNPPKGVQVLTSCSAGQYSYEIQSPILKVRGGVFQYAAIELKNTLNGAEQKIDGPIPAEELKTSLARRLVGPVSGYFNVKKIVAAGNAPKAKTKDNDKGDEKEETVAKIEQTPQLYGVALTKTVAFNTKGEIPPKLKVSLDADPTFQGGTALPSDIGNLLAEQRKIPPLKQGDNSAFYLHLPFAKKSLAAYLAKDDKNSDLRDFVKKAIQVLEETREAFVETTPPPPENPQQKVQFNNGIQARQEKLAEVYSKLDAAYEELKSVADLRAKETPRWKANYDYVCARLLFRMVHFYEYQVVLGKIRKDDLPPFDKNVHSNGYKLSPKAALSDRGDEVTFANQAKKYLKQLADESKGTPWEVIAKREMNTSLGLEWVAY